MCVCVCVCVCVCARARCVYICFGFPALSGHPEHWVEVYVLYYRFSLVIYFTNSVYMSVCLPIHPTSHFPPCYPYSCSLPFFVLFCLVNKIVYTNFFRFPVYALIYSIRSSLSNFLHFVWQSLDPSPSLHMTQFHSFLWLSNIPLCICTTSSLSMPLLMDI